MEYNYFIIAKTPKLLEHYKEMYGTWQDVWGHVLVDVIENRKPFGQGDAMVVKDELEAAGIKWGIDFCIKKEPKTEKQPA